MGLSVKASNQQLLDFEGFGQQSFPTNEQLVLEELKKKSDFSEKYKRVVSNSTTTPAQKLENILSFVRDKKIQAIESLGGDFIIHGLLECQLITPSYEVNSENILVGKKKKNYDNLGFLIQMFSICLKESYDCIFYNDHHRYEQITFYHKEQRDKLPLKLSKFLEIFQIVEVSDYIQEGKTIVSITSFGLDFFALLQNRYPKSFEQTSDSEESLWVLYKKYFKRVFVGFCIFITYSLIAYILWGFIFPPIKSLTPEWVKNFGKSTHSNIEDDLQYIFQPKP